MDTSSKYDCDDGYDMEFGIRWEGSRKNLTVPRICPNGTGIMNTLLIMWEALVISCVLYRQHFKIM